MFLLTDFFQNDTIILFSGEPLKKGIHRRIIILYSFSKRSGNHEYKWCFAYTGVQNTAVSPRCSSRTCGSGSPPHTISASEGLRRISHFPKCSPLWTDTISPHRTGCRCHPPSDRPRSSSACSPQGTDRRCAPCSPGDDDPAGPWFVPAPAVEKEEKLNLPLPSPGDGCGNCDYPAPREASDMFTDFLSMRMGRDRDFSFRMHFRVSGVFPAKQLTDSGNKD